MYAPAVLLLATASLSPAGEHWAFQPVRRPAPPAVRQGSWPSSPLDRFVLARLEEAGLTPSPAADRRTLLRRVYMDLVGLPPSYEEVQAFLHDPDPDAHARVVDRLLASPHYGERWGRHWLDVARYADTKDGVLMYGDDRIRPFAYTYRDYVVRAFNEDLPYDRFIHEQLAADLITPRVEPWRLAALGFLTLGRMYDNNVHDVIDDRIDVVTRGLLGLTVSCARCHDHKYDPIPTADYYSLYGVFASSSEPIEKPLIADPASIPGGPEFEKQAEPKRRELEHMQDAQYAMLAGQARQRVGDYLVKVATTAPDPLENAVYFLSLAPTDLRPPIVARWRRHLEVHGHDDPVFGPWHDLMRLEEKDLAGQAAGVLARWKGRPTGTVPGRVNPLVRDALAGARLTDRASVARTYGDLLRRVYQEAKQKPLPKTDRPDARRQLLALVDGPESPLYFPRSQTLYYMSRGEKDAFAGKVRELDRMAARSPAAPPRAMVLRDMAQPHQPHVFLRGNPTQPAQAVPRQLLAVLAGPDRKPFPHGSGRLDLARAITAPDNPLTARVLVNRVWMHHLGEPLVATPSDFGVRSRPPSHPELLDWLAADFVDHGWSLKHLHRRILLSSTYRQASRVSSPVQLKKDPENRLLGRMRRRRLDLEAMRDTLLAVAGRLDPHVGGRPVDVAGDHSCRRRTVYGLVDRQSLPGLFRAFDFAVPDQTVACRPRTVVPQQALFGMNSPFVLTQARALAAHPEVAGGTPAGRVRALYRRVLARDPDAFELERALTFVSEGAAAGPTGLDAWGQLAQVLLLTNELMYVD